MKSWKEIMIAKKMWKKICQILSSVLCLQMPLGHYIDVIMGTMVSQITSLTFVYSTIYLGTDQRKQPFIQVQIKENIKSSASLAFVGQ